jgi:hypothetical protein
MKCPYCGNEMEQGYVQSARKVFFTTEPHKLLLVPEGDDLLLTTHNWTCPTCDAWHCSSCQKIILSYPQD